MLCPSCVIVIVIIVSVGVSVQPSQWQVWSKKLHILQIYAAMPLVYAHEMLSQRDIYFLNGSHFSKFLYLALLSTWLNLEPSYLAQLCTYTGATHREEIIHLSIIFLKLWIFKKIHIWHFLTHWQTCQRY